MSEDKDPSAGGNAGTPASKTVKAVTNKELAKTTDALQEQLAQQAAEAQNTRAELAAMEGKLDNLGNMLTELSGALTGMSAQDRPTSFNTARVEAPEQDLGGGGANQFARVRDGRRLLQGQRLVDVESPEFKAKMEMEQFMAERLTVHIHDAADEKADPHFGIWVNGREWIFARNTTVENVPRFVVFGLCCARPMHYGNKLVTDGDGVRKYTYPMSRALRYPFSVEYDPSGRRGAEWLRHALKTA